MSEYASSTRSRPQRQRHNVDAIRVRHVENTQHPGHCRECYRAWPCEPAYLSDRLENALITVPPIRQLVAATVRLIQAWEGPDAPENEDPVELFMEAWLSDMLPLKPDVRLLALHLGLGEPWKEDVWEETQGSLPETSPSGPVSTTSTQVIELSTITQADSSPHTETISSHASVAGGRGFGAARETGISLAKKIWDTTA